MVKSDWMKSNREGKFIGTKLMNTNIEFKTSGLSSVARFTEVETVIEKLRLDQTL
jgi:hypothetical protein